MRGTLGPKRSTPATYGQEISVAKKVVESTLNSKNEKLIEYILSVAELKKIGNDCFIAEIGKLSNEAMMIEGVLRENIRRINLYINCLGLKSVKELINKARISLGVDEKCNLVN